MKKLMIAASVGWMLAASAGAQTAPVPAATPAAAVVSPAKKQLVAKVLDILKPGIDNLANSLAAAPALNLRQQLGQVLQQRVAPERREALARDLEADLRKFVDETGPMMRDRAWKLAPSTMGTLFEERFTEEELRQLVVMLESPLYRKYHGMGNDFQRALGDKLLAETRPSVEPRWKALEQTVMRRLNPPDAASAPGR
jgi:hypothetical protein